MIGQRGKSKKSISKTHEKKMAQVGDHEISARIQDRMLRYDHPIKDARACPACGTFPVITMIKRENYHLLRCRNCGKRWGEMR